MTRKPRQLHLTINMYNVGQHEAAWRVLADPRSFYDVSFYRNVARIAERGTLDAVFMGDVPALIEDVGHRPPQALEPTVLLAAIAGSTERIGLVATASTTFNEPFNLARRLASLDHISGGRAAWNAVTTYHAAAAANFGLVDVPSHDDRFARASEFVDVVTKLWDSWEDAAIVGDSSSGVLTDTARIHEINHEGEYFRVRGPSVLPRSPQGRPVLVQAGTSAQGKAFAARYADVVYTAQPTLKGAQAFYAEIRQLAGVAGRDPGSIRILPGIVPVVGDTEKQAWEKKAEIDGLLDIDREVARLARVFGVETSDLSLDEQLPAHVTNAAVRPGGSQGLLQATLTLARDKRLTVRELIAHNGRGHTLVVGTAEQIADEIEQWFSSGAADGFNLNVASLPAGLEDFVERVIPELRERGLFRSEYEGVTLRDHLGLEHPKNQFETKVV
jgi:FMN-dependent oxidoreductase (nitrilotriacetate monooxygenase family)